MSGAPGLAKDLCNTYFTTGYRSAPHASEAIAAMTGHRTTCRIPLIWCHGAAGNAMTPLNAYPENRGFAAFARREPSGIVVISADWGGGLNWGNSDSQTAIDEALAWSA